MTSRILALILALAASAGAQSKFPLNVTSAGNIERNVTFPSGRTLTLNGALNGTPTGGTLNLGSVTLTLPATAAYVATGDSTAAAPSFSHARGGIYFTATPAMGFAIGGVSVGTWTASSLNVSGALLPANSDGGALGSTTKMWSDLFVADGAVINFNNGNAAITHSAGILTVGTGDLRITTAGTDSTSVVTVGGTQTLTGKTLTAPTFADGGFIADPTGNELLIFAPEVDAVNEITLANASNGNPPGFSATGDNANISLLLAPKGSGGVLFPNGTATNPAISFLSQSGTGLYYDATPYLGFAVNGVSVGTWTGTAFNVSTALLPSTSDGGALGSTTKMWSDLFVADGAVINFNNGNVALTHSAGILTVGTGDLRITTAGTNSASVVTVGGTQTLSGKTLAAPKFADLDYVADANGNELLVLDTVASAVNELKLANAATGTNPSLSASGGDTNVSIGLMPKGTGGLGVGTSTPSARIHGIYTAEQLRLGYDATYFWKFTVGSGGAMSITPSGTAAWTFYKSDGTTAALAVNTMTAGITVGGGTAINKVISATATLDFPDTVAGAVSDLTITVTGAALGDVVALGVPHGSVPGGGSFTAWVSGTDAVTVRFANNSILSGSYDPDSGTFRATVIQH